MYEFCGIIAIDITTSLAEGKHLPFFCLYCFQYFMLSPLKPQIKTMNKKYEERFVGFRQPID